MAQHSMAQRTIQRNMIQGVMKCMAQLSMTQHSASGAPAVVAATSSDAATAAATKSNRLCDDAISRYICLV